MHPSRPTRRRIAALTATTLTAALVPFVATAPTANATSAELFFSEYLEGSSNNKALEIFNGTGSAVDLAAGGYNVQMFFNGATSAGLTVNLSGSVATGDVFVLAQASADPAILSVADQTNGAGWFNGDDAVVLRKGSTVLDVIGQIGVDPGTEWGSGATSTADNTLRRQASVGAGDADGSNAFDPALEWDGFARDTFDGLGSHTFTGEPSTDSAPAVAATTPAGSARDVPVTSTVTVTFTEPVAAAPGAFELYCAATGAVAVVVSGGPATFTLDPTADLVPSDRCFVTIAAAAVTDKDAVDPPDSMADDATISFSTETASDVCVLPYQEISAIQGEGPEVTTRNTVTTEGVVVGDYEGASPNLRGFYLQDLEGDGKAATSDGIFVFEGSNADTVAVGDVVRVTGRAGENQGQSQIALSAAPQPCGTASVEPTDVTFPVASPTSLEQVEGMLVSVPQEMTVTEHFQLGRFGQVVVSSGGRLQQPTNVVEPGAEALSLQASNTLRRLIIDDATQVQNPDPIVFGRNGHELTAQNTLRGGDTVTGAVGVMTYTWAGNAASGNAYRLRPLGALDGEAVFVGANPRPAGAPDVGGRIQVAGMNVLNYFNTWDGLPDKVDNCTGGVGGAAMDCRGADTELEFERQSAKTVQAILGTGAEVVGLVEIENDGYGPDSALADLVGRLNAASAPGTWAYVDVDARTGQVNALGTDAIKVGVVYQPQVVVPRGDTAALNTESFVTGGDGQERNRPALAQAFVEKSTGGSFVAVVNHLKSKGSACDTPDQGDGQGNCTEVRVAAATELAQWLGTDPTNTGETDNLVLGDLNSYAKEDPVAVLRNAGYTDLVNAHQGQAAYSYAFDGQWGYLDHALATSTLTRQVTGAADWHINADEPSVLDYNTDFKTERQVGLLYAPDQYRVSDHDPVIVGLDLTPGKSGGTGRR